MTVGFRWMCVGWLLFFWLLQGYGLYVGWVEFEEAQFKAMVYIIALYVIFDGIAAREKQN